jgi:hypothetical protein
VSHSSDSKKKDPSTDEEAQAFTHDSENSSAQEVPSISLLLNRKKLPARLEEKHDEPLPQTEWQKDLPADPTQALDPAQVEVENQAMKSEVSLILEAPQGLHLHVESPASAAVPESATPVRVIEAPEAQAPRAKIQRAPKRDGAPAKKLIEWNAKSFAQSPDPLARALAVLVPKGVSAGAFLAIQPPAAAGKTPHFSAAAAFADKSRMRTWKGLVWDPTLLPDLWNQFIQTGNVELPPPGANTTITSARNVVRTAFAVEPNEWITLLRVGPANACRGVLALISTQSMQKVLGPVLPLVHAAVKKASPTSEAA